MAPRRAGSYLASACEMPWRTAPAWPDSPPPETVATTSNWLAALRDVERLLDDQAAASAERNRPSDRGR